MPISNIEASEETEKSDVRYPGILSNYDYRKMTPDSLLEESKRIVKVGKDQVIPEIIFCSLRL